MYERVPERFSLIIHSFCLIKFLKSKIKELFAVLGKRPKAGLSKTRLAQEIGVQQSLALYQSFMDDFFFRFEEVWGTRPFYFFATPNEGETRRYFDTLFSLFDLMPKFEFQREISFFERLQDIFNRIHFREGGETFIHLTGTDIPDFPFEILKDVDGSSSDVDVFLGPDSDGGYYYIGAHAKHSKIFAIEDAKGPKENLLKQCQRMGLSVKLLKEWSDIDTMEDLKRCLTRSGPEKIPSTHKCWRMLEEAESMNE